MLRKRRLVQQDELLTRLEAVAVEAAVRSGNFERELAGLKLETEAREEEAAALAGILGPVVPVSQGSTSSQQLAEQLQLLVRQHETLLQEHNQLLVSKLPQVCC